MDVRLKSFRLWTQEMWFEHMDELTDYGLPVSYSSKEYFQRYKYWLKREYIHQIKRSK